MSFFKNFEKKTISVKETDINVVIGGSGPPVILLHGYPQSHLMWHKVAPMLADQFTVVATDLRGYGDSGKPVAEKDHSGYSKRASANDQVQVMRALGYRSFYVVGHDRGARVGHRLALDFPNTVKKLISLDVIPTTQIFESIDALSAKAYFHWFLMLQPEPLAETLIGQSAEFYLRWLLDRWCSIPGSIPEPVFQDYLRCFIKPNAIHCMCEDYRAVYLDMQHDQESRDSKVKCPVLALWGAGQTQHPGWPSMHLDVLAEWSKRAETVEGWGINSGHFMPEEAPDQVYKAIVDFLI